MTLRINVSRALRSHHSYVELVQAIVAAPLSTQETHAVEWKTEVTLAEKVWRAKLAKGVLGFANRDPAVVPQWFEGCAYLVAGAAPGRLVGTEVLDTAKVEAALAPYVGKGTAGPDWSSSYVDVDGKSVLILTIEPPRVGSRIWTFQKEFTTPGEPPIRAGTIFVRHQASTDPAGPEDVDMLARRAAATGARLGGLTLVLPAAASAVPIDLRDKTVGAWVESEREAMTLPPAPPHESQLAGLNVVPPDTVIDPTKHRILTREEILTAAAADIGAGLSAKFKLPDPRSREKYQAELDAYLRKAGKALPGLLLRSAVRRSMGRIALVVRNETLDNYHAVEVELHIDVPGVMAFFDTGDVAGYRLPERPVAWGKGGLSMFDSMRYLAFLRSPVIPNVFAKRGNIDNGDSSRITLHPVDVRPKRSAELDTFYLVVHPELVGRTITATWTATATDASGNMEGTLDIPVMAGVPTTAELLGDDAYNDDGDFDLDDE